MDRVQYSLFEHGPFCFRTFPNKVLSVERLVERLFSISPSILSSTMANATGKNDNFRRTWDRDEYEKKAKERVQELEDDEDDESSSKGRPSAPVKRELLKRREYDVDLEVNLGKSVVITKTTPLSHTGGYYCNVCDCVVKDSVNFLDHINGKKHQRNLGMSMKVERSSLDQVKRRFELNKRKREEEKQKKDKDYDLEERMAVLREEEEQRKQQRKIARKEKKQKTAAVDDGEIDPDLAATMGFAGFGSSKK